MDITNRHGEPLNGRIELYERHRSDQMYVMPRPSDAHLLERRLTNAIASCIPVRVQRFLRRRYAAILDIPPTLGLRVMAIVRQAEEAAGQEVRYGPGSQHRLDLYDAPPSAGAGAPVMIFVHGGAWSSGNKAFYCLFGRRMALSGCTCCVLGYRLMKPGEDATMAEQMEDVARAVRWARRRFRLRRLVLAGHSSGAHVLMLALLRGAVAGGEGVLDVDAVIGLSGPYHIRDHFEFERSRGLHELSPMGQVHELGPTHQGTTDQGTRKSRFVTQKSMW